MNFKNMTKQQLKEYGETIGIKLDIKKKKDVLIEELNKAIKGKASEVSSPVLQTNQHLILSNIYGWLYLQSC